jgi:hypothetical protein
MDIAPGTSTVALDAGNTVPRVTGGASPGVLSGTIALSEVSTPSAMPPVRRTNDDDPIVSDEVLAIRLAEELNATGRKRRAPEPVFTPLASWRPSKAAGAKAKKAVKPKNTKKKHTQKKPKNDDAAASPPRSDSDDDDDALLCDFKWQESLPAKELSPPNGFLAGDLVWVGLGSKGNPLWWPGRVWKLRNCQSAEALWRRRGAPPSVQKALVRCFGDDSFAWATHDTLAAFYTHQHEDIERLGTEENTTAAVDAATSLLIREKHDLCFSELLAIASSKPGHVRKKGKSKHGLRIVASVAHRALESAEEASMGAWVPSWSASEGEENGEDGDGDDDEGTEITASTRRKKQQTIVDPRHACRKYEPREDGEKDGLTPDWVIDAGCIVFGLKPPTVDTPTIKGLLDPCTNNKRRPNIPAEKLYDKTDDGLRQENSWKGYHVILNPSYENTVQWRFINRAINEVEWGFCPGVLLVCRNSTDTSYFQRLVPFPRVFLRRDAIMFKDYTNSPVGFGICVFCLVGSTLRKQEKIETYKRFHEQFAHAGEFNVPFDREFMDTKQFGELTDRLHTQAQEKFRDSWVACDKCDRWREICTSSLLQIGKEMSWRCADAYGVDVGCSAPLTDREFKAFSVARKGHALALTANKAGTDIIGYGEETEVLALPGTGGDSGDDEDDDDDEGGWNKVEKDERDLRDDGDEDDGDDEGNIKDDVGDATTATTAATNTSLDPMDTWRDEVSLRGGRKRFVLDRPKLAKKRKPKRVNTSAETTCANDATPLNAFERERLENDMRNKQMLKEICLGNASAQRQDVENDSQTNTKTTLEVLETAAAEASSKLAAATRVLKSASIEAAKSFEISENLLSRARKAAAHARVAEKEAAVAETEAIDSRAEEFAARAMVARLVLNADHAEKECDDYDK